MRKLRNYELRQITKLRIIQKRRYSGEIIRQNSVMQRTFAVVFVAEAVAPQSSRLTSEETDTGR